MLSCYHNPLFQRPIDKYESQAIQHSPDGRHKTHYQKNTTQYPLMPTAQEIR